MSNLTRSEPTRRAEPVIFLASAALTLVFLLATSVFTDSTGQFAGAVAGWLRQNLGWLYILGGTTFLIYLLWVGLSRFGHVRLGGQDARPQFGRTSWLAMVFGAMMATVLMFWGVAEPITHYMEPPRGDVQPQTVGAADEAMGYSLFHFGLHSWALICLPALTIAYFAYQRGLPFRPSSVLHPLLGDRTGGPIGRTIDVITLTGALLGVAVVLGMGMLHFDGGAVRVLLIGLVAVVAGFLSLVRIKRGIRPLALSGGVLSLALLLFVFVNNEVLFLAKGIVETAGNYLRWLGPLSFWTDTFANTGWVANWTVFYWAWMIAWTPLVGIFIARISKGRTIRQFVIGVLVVPTLICVVWFGVFGLSAIRGQHRRAVDLSQLLVQSGEIPGTLFGLLERYPFASIGTAIAAVAVLVFFVTSMTSASIAMNLACVHDDPSGRPNPMRATWPALMGVLAGVLAALAGKGSGLATLQDITVVLGFPSLLLMFVMMVSLTRALRADNPALNYSALIAQKELQR